MNIVSLIVAHTENKLEMVTEAELTADIDELKSLLSQAVRQNVKNLLASQIQRLETELQTVRQTQTNEKSTTGGSTNLPLPLMKISTYAWDESDTFLKLYVTVPGIDSSQENSVSLKYGPRSVSLLCNNITGKNYEMTIAGLLKQIDPVNSRHKIKDGEVLVMLRKVKTGETWGCVTEQENRLQEKKKSKFDKDEDPNAALMNMMKNMYDEGDDETKRTIKKAWFESQQKKQSGGGLGDMGMGGDF